MNKTKSHHHHNHHNLSLETLPLKICLITSILVLYQLKCIHGNYEKNSYGSYGKRRYGDYEMRNYDSYGKQIYDRYESSGISSTLKTQNRTAVVEAVEIPYPVRVGQNVQLKCKWKVGVIGFFALRWYKNNEQFYSYLKGEHPQTHQLKGISVTMSESDDHVLTLRNVTPEAEGMYKCEIMEEAPRFKISHKIAKLTVVELPETPIFIGLRHKYRIGDIVNVTCRAANGRPAPDIVIKVNDIEMQIDLPTTIGDRPGVYTSQSRVFFILENIHTPSFTLGCYADTHGLKVQKEINIYVHERQHFLQRLFSSTNDGTSLNKSSDRGVLSLAMGLALQLLEWILQRSI